MTRTRSLLWTAVVAVLVVLTMGGTALGRGQGEITPITASGTAAATVGTAAATPGCGKAPTLTSGTHTIQSGGKNRNFILRIPDGYDRNRPYRLVFGFHWLGGTSTDVATGRTVETGTWAYYGLQRLANNSAIFVAPQGLNNGWANAGGEDVTLVDDMIRRIEAALCVDTTQRFALGFSYGGAMSYALACSRATVFRAVAVQSGGQLSGCSGGTQPIAYLGVHGLRDSVLGISGGRALRDRFVRNNGCTPQNPPEPAQGSLTHRVTTYAGCSAGHPVAWAAFDEGHIAAPQDGAAGDSGSRTWLPQEVWKFFTQFHTSNPAPGTASCRITGTVRNASHNAALAPGASADLGFQAAHTGNTAPPTSYTLNGTACAVTGSAPK